jgi:hypothetical protein
MTITNYGILPATVFNFLSAPQLFVTLIFLKGDYIGTLTTVASPTKLIIVKSVIKSTFIILNFDHFYLTAVCQLLINYYSL